MQLVINGKASEVSAGTIESLLHELKLLSTQVAVEHNGKVLFRHEFPETSLVSGDRVEIIRVVAGG
jgi:thiamine biosynthesis protein ThiS